MKLFTFEDYEEYKNAQIRNNKRKLSRTWAVKGEMRYLVPEIRKRVPNVKEGLCHGVRNNNETKWFYEFFGGDVEMLGSDISPTVKQFGGVQWDFHDMNPDWAGRFDFIYSNSLDHSYDPHKALRTWLKCLKPNGVLVVQWSPCGSRDAPLSNVDCFAARLREYENMAREVGSLKDVLKNKEIRKQDKVLLYWLFIGKNRELKML
jgi:SAM-dependent methyltransferase